MQVSPNVDKFTIVSVVRRRIEEILESCRFCLCISRRLVPIGFGMCQVLRGWCNIEVTCPDDGLFSIKHVEVSEKVLVPYVLCSKRLETECQESISGRSVGNLPVAFGLHLLRMFLQRSRTQIQE